MKAPWLSHNDRHGAVGLAVAGAALMHVALPPWNFWPAGLIAWLPLAFLVSSGRHPSRAALAGWLQGVLAQTVALSGLPAALQTGGGMSPLPAVAAFLLVVVWEGGRTAAIAFAAARIVKHGWPLVVALPGAVVAIELVYPMFLPWTSYIFLHDSPLLLQTAELAGAEAISFWMAFFCAAIASACLARGRRGARVWSPLVLPLATFVTVAAYGTLRMRAVDRASDGASAARIGFVQGNVRSDEDPADTLDLYRQLSARLTRKADHLDLVVWPEAAVSTPVAAAALSHFLEERVFRPTRAVGSGPQRLDVPLLAGVVVEHSPRESPAHVRLAPPATPAQAVAPPRYNAAVLATPDGRVRAIYDKQALMVFGEYIPLEHRFPWLRKLLPKAGRFAQGAFSTPAVLGGRRLAVSICLEDILDEPIRRAVQTGAPELLVNLTSDAWFGESRIPALHLALARLRAIEHRRFLVHATNTGVSATVDPNGRLVTSLPPLRAASAATTIRWLCPRTIYEEVGRAPWITLAAIVLLCSFCRRELAWLTLRRALQHG